MNIVYAQTKINKNINGNVFLAGPTPRDENIPSWRPKAIDIFRDLGFEGNIFVPEMEHGWDKNFEYATQIEWEEKALTKSDIIIFWIPRDLKTMPAFTTNIEWGTWTTKDPQKVVLGYPEGTKKMDYLTYYAKKLDIPVLNTLYDTIKISNDKINDQKSLQELWIKTGLFI